MLILSRLSRFGSHCSRPILRTIARAVRGWSAFATTTGAAYPDFFNAPVPNWGDAEPGLMIVGLRPG